MDENKKELIRVNPQGVFFIPYKENNILLMLPIIPPKTLMGQPDYKDFLNEFENIEWNRRLEIDDDNIIFEVKITHKNVEFTFPAWKIYHEAMDMCSAVYVIPYCLQEGIPKQELQGYVFCLKQQDKPPFVDNTSNYSSNSIMSMLQDVITEVEEDGNLND